MAFSNQPQAVERLAEILNQYSDAQSALQSGLRFLLQESGIQGGVLYIQGKKTGDDYLWLSENIPPAWQTMLNLRESRLHQTAIEIARSQRPAPTQPEMFLVGGIPICLNQQCLGGILFYHPSAIPLPGENLALLTPMLAGLILNNLSFFASQILFNQALLELEAATENFGLGLKEIQLRVANGIQKLIEPDAINLYLVFPEKGNLLEKISQSYHSQRIMQSAVFLTHSLIETCIREKTIQTIHNLTSHPDFNPEIDGADNLDAAVALFIPMLVGGAVVGAAELLFRQAPALSSYQQNMLNTIVTALGYSIINARLMQQLRVANADIEANRWEVVRSRNILRALFDSLPSSIYIIDQNSKVIAVNMSRAKRADSHPMQLVGKKCYEAMYHRSEPCSGCLVNETLFAGSSTMRNSRIWIEDQVVDWEIATFAILNDNNQPAQAILIEQDVTEKRRLEANLVQSEKLAAVGQLAAGVAHEINNPLAAIIANAQILARELAGDEDKMESVKLIELAGTRASQVVKNLLGFARKEQYDFEPINLNISLQNAIRLVSHELMSHSVTHKSDLADDLPPLLASQDHLQGVWVNLMMNALDAMEGQSGRLLITSRFVNGEFRVTIADNGQGIPPERISRIFEPFYTTKNPGRGTGLGLSLCHRIIKHHGGYITVDSQVGVGTQFTIVLPGNTGTSQPKTQGG